METVRKWAIIAQGAVDSNPTTQTICKDFTTGRTACPVHTPPTQRHEWFAVDRLLKSKLVNGQKHYLIKWKGKFPNSLEPEDHISDYCK